MPVGVAWSSKRFEQFFDTNVPQKVSKRAPGRSQPMASPGCSMTRFCGQEDAMDTRPKIDRPGARFDTFCGTLVSKNCSNRLEDHATPTGISALAAKGSHQSYTRVCTKNGIPVCTGEAVRPTARPKDAFFRT
eukprot:gene15312-biopygen643